jgi:hypothetical protein
MPSTIRALAHRQKQIGKKLQAAFSLKTWF